MSFELFSANTCDCELGNYKLYHELIGGDSQLSLRDAVVASKRILYRLLNENFQFIFRVNRKKLNFMLKNGVLTTSTLSLSVAFDFWLRNSSPMKIWIDWVALGSIWLLPPLMVIVSVVMINSWVVV